MEKNIKKLPVDIISKEKRNIKYGIKITILTQICSKIETRVYHG